MSRDALHPTVPPGLCVAFYKGNRPGVAGLYNRLGRFLDRGPYSHCELVFSDGVSASSSFMDGGVRFKQIGYSSAGNWDFLQLPAKYNLEARARAWFELHDGTGYDVWGNIRFGIGFARDSADKWFCSEAVVAALWLEQDAFRWGPSGAYQLLTNYYQGRLVRVPKPMETQP